MPTSPVISRLQLDASRRNVVANQDHRPGTWPCTDVTREDQPHASPYLLRGRTRGSAPCRLRLRAGSRAARQALLAGAAGITREALAAAVAEFLPSTQSLEKEMQEIAAILECTDRQFLPPEILEKMNAFGGREKLQERYTQLRRMIELA